LRHVKPPPNPVVSWFGGGILATAALLLGAPPANAHHSFALFDTEKLVTLEGTVKRFEWTNPHSWIYLEVLSPQNVAEEWMIELPAAGVLARDGWNKFYLKPGEKISVHINPLRNGQRGGSLASFMPTNGQKE
jgi:hypothetical protein